MTDDLPTTPAVTGDALRAAADLVRSYFQAMSERGEDTQEGVLALAEMGGMADDFVEAAAEIAAERATVAMEVSGTPPDVTPFTQLTIPAGALHNMVASAYMHGMQVGALAVTVTHPTG